jgi:hypothetical protein
MEISIVIIILSVTNTLFKFEKERRKSARIAERLSQSATKKRLA